MVVHIFYFPLSTELIALSYYDSNSDVTKHCGQVIDSSALYMGDPKLKS
jgi:hypothetical protein